MTYARFITSCVGLNAVIAFHLGAGEKEETPFAGKNDIWSIGVNGAIEPQHISYNAAARMNGLSYSKMMHGLKVANIDINRKMLAEMAVNDAAGFTALAEIAKKAIA